MSKFLITYLHEGSPLLSEVYESNRQELAEKYAKDNERIHEADDVRVEVVESE